MDGNLLNTFVHAFGVLANYKSSNEDKSISIEIIENLKKNEFLCFDVGVFLLSNEDYGNNYTHNNVNLSYLNLAGSQLIEHSIKFHNNYFNQNIEKIKKIVLFVLSKNNQFYSVPLRHSLSRIVCEVSKKTWPALWTTFLSDIGSLASYGEVQLEIVLNILLRLSEDLNGMDESIPMIRKREMIEMLASAQSDIFALFRHHILFYFQSGNCMSSNEKILRDILNTLSGFIGWSSLDHIFGLSCSNNNEDSMNNHSAAQLNLAIIFQNFNSNNIVHMLLILLKHADNGVIKLTLECLQKLSERKLKSHYDSFLILLSDYSLNALEYIFLNNKNEDIQNAIIQFASTMESNQIVARIELGKASFEKINFQRFFNMIILFTSNTNYDISLAVLNIVGNIFKRSELFVRCVIIDKVSYILDTLINITYKSGLNFLCETQLKNLKNTDNPDTLSSEEINKITYVTCNFVCKAFPELAYELISIRIFNDLSNLLLDKENKHKKQLFIVTGYICHHIFNFFYSTSNINKNHQCSKDNNLFYTYTQTNQNSVWDIIKFGNFLMERLIDCTFEDLLCRCIQIIIIRAMINQIDHQNSVIVSIVQKSASYLHQQYTVIENCPLFEDCSHSNDNLKYSVRLEKEIGCLFQEICKSHASSMKEMFDAIWPLLLGFCQARHFHHSSTEMILDSLIDLNFLIYPSVKTSFIVNLSKPLVEFHENKEFQLFCSEFSEHFNVTIYKSVICKEKLSFNDNHYGNMVRFVNLFSVISQKISNFEAQNDSEFFTKLQDGCYNISYQLFYHSILIWKTSSINKYPAEFSKALLGESNSNIVPYVLQANTRLNNYSDNVLKLSSFIKHVLEKCCIIERKRLINFYERKLISFIELVNSIEIIWSQILNLTLSRIYYFLKNFMRKILEFIMKEQQHFDEFYGLFSKFCIDIYKLIKSKRVHFKDDVESTDQDSKNINDEIYCDFLYNLFVKESLNIINSCIFNKSNNNSTSKTSSSGNLFTEDENSLRTLNGSHSSMNVTNQIDIMESNVDFQNCFTWKTPTSYWSVLCSLYFELCCSDESIAVRSVTNYMDLLSKYMIQRFSNGAHDRLTEIQLIDQCYCSVIKVLHLHNMDGNIVGTFLTILLKFYDFSKTNGFTFHIDRLSQMCSISFNELQEFDKKLTELLTTTHYVINVKHRKSRDYLKMLLANSIKKFNSCKKHVVDEKLTTDFCNLYPIDLDLIEQRNRRNKTLAEQNLKDNHNLNEMINHPIRDILDGSSNS